MDQVAPFRAAGQQLLDALAGCFMKLVQGGQIGGAAAYVIGSTCLSLAAVATGALIAGRLA